MPTNSKSSSSSRMTDELNYMGVFSAGNLGKAAPFLAALEQQLYQSIVPRRSSNAPLAPLDEAISMARQQKTISFGDNDDGEGSALDNYFRVPYEADGPIHETDDDVERGLGEETCHETEQEPSAVTEAFWFIRDFIEARWPVQLLAGYIKIQCDLTLDEVKELGRLSKVEGSRKCRKLVSAPVIHDEIGYALWSELAREIAARGEAPGEDTQMIKAAPGLTKAMTSPSPMNKVTTEEVAARRVRSTRRRATDGDTIAVQSRPGTPSTHVSTTARRRRKSDMQLVRPHQVICTTCGSRAVPRPKGDDDDDDDDSVMSNGEDEDDPEEEELEFKVKKRDSISRRLSVKMNRTLTKFGEGLATGYGGNGVNRVAG
ncbi:hypothetical protein LX32DRAFT_347540 [Colletotrichum zoysiae]|uniref:Uncharacterized protein n=1 Tax=Colletotrichum zoysiae TaxID=1216348 RepID=A0AAD9HKI0_9PEZI|nr:hypothetical protein LX32DRAFT_347540 [Colletotrichum zoysiae]